MLVAGSVEDAERSIQERFGGELDGQRLGAEPVGETAVVDVVGEVGVYSLLFFIVRKFSFKNRSRLKDVFDYIGNSFANVAY